MQRTRKAAALARALAFASITSLASLFCWGGAAHAGDGFFEEGRLSLWSFVTFIFLVVVMLVFSVVVRSVLPSKGKEAKAKKKAAAQAALTGEAPRKALPPGRRSPEGEAEESGELAPQRKRGSVVSVKRQLARHTADMASLKTWCEEQDPEQALAVIRRWLKAEMVKSKTAED